MTEPVAYMLSDFVGNDFTSLELPKNPNNPRGLYFKDQLHQRVKMTKKQYERLMWDKQNSDLSTCLEYFLEHDGVNKFGLPSDNLMGFLKQEDIARAWLKSEETIEIVPDMKWFVQKKYCETELKFLKTFERVLGYSFTKDYATRFDTKEEAELWTNPLTEAVQLAVEDE